MIEKRKKKKEEGKERRKHTHPVIRRPPVRRHHQRIDVVLRGLVRRGPDPLEAGHAGERGPEGLDALDDGLLVAGVVEERLRGDDHAEGPGDGRAAAGDLAAA